MKTFIALALSASTFFALGQEARHGNASLTSDNDRISLVKTSVRLAEWHEKAFWPLYEQYLSERGKVAIDGYRALDDVSEVKGDMSQEDAFSAAWSFLSSRSKEIEIRKKFYQQMGAALNGVIALQFLQTEAMMGMLENSKFYQETEWKHFGLNTQELDSKEAASAKRNLMARAVELPEEKKNTFWAIYSRYQDDLDALLGQDYSVYGLFASDATDFTPALAKRLGHDLLSVMEREMRLKERYFLEMHAAVGGVPAAQFLAFEDYQSVIAKMYAWAEPQ